MTIRKICKVLIFDVWLFSFTALLYAMMLTCYGLNFLKVLMHSHQVTIDRLIRLH